MRLPKKTKTKHGTKQTYKILCTLILTTCKSTKRILAPSLYLSLSVYILLLLPTTKQVRVGRRALSLITLHTLPTFTFLLCSLLYHNQTAATLLIHPFIQWFLWCDVSVCLSVKPCNINPKYYYTRNNMQFVSSYRYIHTTMICTSYVLLIWSSSYPIVFSKNREHYEYHTK